MQKLRTCEKRRTSESHSALRDPTCSQVWYSRFCRSASVKFLGRSMAASLSRNSHSAHTSDDSGARASSAAVV